MKTMRSVLAVFLVCLAALPARADGDYQAKLARWRSLTKEEKDRVREHYQAWKGLPADMRDELARRSSQIPADKREKLRKRLAQMPPAMRREFLSRLRQLPPQRRALFKEVFKALRNVAPEDRQRLRGLPPDKRRQEIRNLVLEQLAKEHLGEEERKKFLSLPPEERLQRVREWMRDRVKRGPK